MDDSDNNPYQSDVDVEEYYQTAISKLGKEKVDAYHELTRDNLQDVDLEYVQAGFEGLEYRRFLKTHFYMQSCFEGVLHDLGDRTAKDVEMIQTIRAE
jgi:hypothetical protein